MKRTQLNAGLGVVAVGIAVAVWVSQKKEETLAPLTTLAPAAVTAITLEHPGAAPIRLQKTGTVWALTAPVQAEADPFEVNALVGLANTDIQASLDTGVDLKPLGLQPAAYTVTLNDQAIEFGGEEPLKYRRYVRVAGKALALINDPPSQALDKDYSDLVAKNPIPSGADITRIALPGLTLDKTAGGVWSSGDHPQARPEQLQAVANAWKAAKSMWNGPAAAAEKTAGEEAGVTLSDGRVLKFVIVSREPQLALALPDLGVTYTLGKDEADKLLKLAEAPAAPAAEPVTEGATPGADAALPSTEAKPQTTATPPPESASP